MPRWPEKSTEERFWSQVHKTDTCWLWTGAVLFSGYGAFRVKGQTRSTHRFSYVLQNGSITSGAFVCHTCDVRLCVNPAHLFEGTHTDNMRDCAAKGRFHRGLRPAQVEYLLAEYAKGGRTKRSFAEELGVTETTIGHVLNRRTWK
jgi:hypothetical protein